MPDNEGPATRIDAVEGLSPAIDRIAESGPTPLAFMRRAWFGEPGKARTIVASRGARPIAAIVTRPAGPALIGARAVPGPYWPFRAILLDIDISDVEIRALLESPDLPPLWRLGPVYRDAQMVRLRRAARRAGWTILTRRSGRSWLLDIPKLREDEQWPRPSTLKKNRAHLRRLASRGDVEWRSVSGSSWDASAFDALAAIEAKSWVAERTDQSGAKFLRAEQRAVWQRAARDPVLAEMLRAILLYVGGAPAAFSFDLVAGATQYGLASSYDPAFADYRVGRLVSWRQIEAAIEAGVTRIDWGAGDSGYKREAGAVPGPLIDDYLFVRGAAWASLLRPRWERRPAAADDAKAPFGGSWEADADPHGALSSLLLAGAAVAAAAALGSD